jgi:site-specific DNA-methyltransferase (adenine-specific)
MYNGRAQISAKVTGHKAVFSASSEGRRTQFLNVENKSVTVAAPKADGTKPKTEKPDAKSKPKAKAEAAPSAKAPSAAGTPVSPKVVVDIASIDRERILKAASNEGDVVLDPFCGCGTTIHAAEKLNRQWIGIDVTHLAIGLIRDRLRDAFPQATFDVYGVPRDLAAARELAANDKHEFQLWTLSLINAQPYKGGRKGADGGVDGYIWFQPDGRNHEKAVVSVKGGENVDVKMIRDLIATVDREKAKVGVFVTLTEPTRPMKTEAAAAGFYDSPNHGRFPKIQILTIADLFAHQKPHLPWIAPSSKRAKREQGADKQMGLDV